MMKMNLLVVLALLAAPVYAAPEYKADQKMGEGGFKAGIRALAVAGEKLFALEGNGNVQIFSTTSGKLESKIETGMNNTGAMALDAQGQIYVLATETEKKEVTRGNRKRTITVSTGVICKVFDQRGKELRTVQLEGPKSAKAANLVGDKLVVADMQQRTLFYLDAATGKKTAELKKGLRLCCGIFDFCIGPNNTVAVSNLGAFKLQQYDLNGKLVKAFGQRGRKLDDFHGCCNPVSAGYLADGSIVTVEKSPTRIKVYAPDGKQAKLIEGVEELVQGCSHIPIAIDAQGNVFLAASRKGYLVKCGPKS
jgi:sugar lactone lactonase YvrE